jgi:hypothetical protein
VPKGPIPSQKKKIKHTRTRARFLSIHLKREFFCFYLSLSLSHAHTFKHELCVRFVFAFFCRAALRGAFFVQLFFFIIFFPEKIR